MEIAFTFGGLFVGAAGIFAVELIRARRQRRRVERLAKMVGLNPMPGERTDELLARVSNRLTIRGGWR